MAIAGPSSGRMMRKKIFSSPAPSMRPASTRSLGRPLMNCRMRNTPKDPTRNGRISPGSVLARPMLATSTKSGTKVTTPGIIRVARMRAKMTFLPRKLSIANAYPTAEQKSRLPAVTVTATMVELAK